MTHRGCLGCKKKLYERFKQLPSHVTELEDEVVINKGGMADLNVKLKEAKNERLV